MLLVRVAVNQMLLEFGIAINCVVWQWCMCLGGCLGLARANKNY